MSKLGYFLGGALTGIIGTVIAAYAVDACSSSDTGASADLDAGWPAAFVEEENTAGVECNADNGNEEPCTA